MKNTVLRLSKTKSIKVFISGWTTRERKRGCCVVHYYFHTTFVFTHSLSFSTLPVCVCKENSVAKEKKIQNVLK